MHDGGNHQVQHTGQTSKVGREWWRKDMGYQSRREIRYRESGPVSSYIKFGTDIEPAPAGWNFTVGRADPR